MEKKENEYRAEFQLILYAGNARSDAINAIDFENAQKLILKANEELIKAHEIEKNLVIDELNGVKYNFGILMMHAQDHLNAAQIIIDQANDYINIYGRLKKIERRLEI